MRPFLGVSNQLIQKAIRSPPARNIYRYRFPNTAMSSDADYASFLDKANEDPNAGTASSKSQPKKSFGTRAVNAKVPKELEKVDEFYVSDSDEPFEPVSLDWDGDKFPDPSTYSLP
jgi:hypothetical protein